MGWGHLSDLQREFYIQCVKEVLRHKAGHIGLGAEAVEAKPRRYTAVLSPCALSAVGRVAFNRTMHPALRGEYERRT